MKKLSIQFSRTFEDSVHVGTLAEERGRIYFEYAADYLSTGTSLSPFRLPFRGGLFEHTQREFNALPGLFDDSLPDGWGLLLMDRHFQRLGRPLATMSPLDRLAWLGTRTMGALTYHPPTARQDGDSGIFELHELARQSREILAGKATEILPQLLRAGGSPGGARPKVLVGYAPTTGEMLSGEESLPPGFEHWIVKFTGAEDDADAAAIEYAYALMAKAAGIHMPPTQLFETKDGERFFGVKRFDRAWDRRYHVHTFGNLIHADFRVPSDYGDLLKATSVLTRSQKEVRRAFRQMVFNVGTHNRDDHVKNFAFLLDDTSGEWALTPAYDLTFAAGPGGEHTMTVAGEGKRPTREHMLHLAKNASIPDKTAHTIMDEMRAAILSWAQFAEEAGVSKEGRTIVKRAFP
ncbi:MAG: type II toxin-antitoxin system HipA family toxin [Deltaproteobacteria bacterium]|nr:type II toxin-antitoxin system HipA family toxin [Deltaproteobacteria bacterium]